jgi:hypothetical protein
MQLSCLLGQKALLESSRKVINPLCLCPHYQYTDLYTVTIRLAPVLPTTVAVVQFPDVRKATEAVTEIMNQGVGIRELYRLLPSTSTLTPTRNRMRRTRRRRFHVRYEQIWHVPTQVS